MAAHEQKHRFNLLLIFETNEKIRDNFKVKIFFLFFNVLLKQYSKQGTTGAKSLWKGATNHESLRITCLNQPLMLLIIRNNLIQRVEFLILSQKY